VALDTDVGTRRGGLERHTHDCPRGVSIACLTRADGARCTIARAKPGSRNGPTSVFASLLDADPELPPSTVERVSGVLGLCRRWRLPTARVGQAVAEISEDLDGSITGAEIEPDGTRVAVTDDDDRAPDLAVDRRPLTGDAASGRGMAIVGVVADEVGVSQHAGDKAVWARIAWRKQRPR
jgi:hypothetical protein